MVDGSNAGGGPTLADRPSNRLLLQFGLVFIRTNPAMLPELRP